MKSYSYRTARHRRNDGQALLLFTLFLLVLILFVGLGVDLGFAYITKAQLSKAIDAATLAGVSDYQQSDNGLAASNSALNTFYANYATNGLPGRDTGTVTPSIGFSTDANTNRTISVSASATIKTFFIRVLPLWKTLTVSDSAQATRQKVIMTLVLDRSGSMDPGCSGSGCSKGGLYLPGAVSQFINVFDDESDQAAVVTFASSVSNDVVMSTPFKTKVNNAVSYINNNDLWSGATFAHGGLSNALAINNSINAPNSIKVVVFFTDGLANVVQNNFTTSGSGSSSTPCSGSGTSQPWNFGGFNPVSTDPVGFYLTNAPVTFCAQETPVCETTGSGNYSGCPNFANCPCAAKFPSIGGTNLPVRMDTIVPEALSRCIQAANQMRAASNYVYAIGLDTQQVGGPTLEFLQEVANDPGSDVFDNTKPVGAALISNGTDLTQVFQQIASDIILRLIK